MNQRRYREAIEERAALYSRRSVMARFAALVVAAGAVTITSPTRRTIATAAVVIAALGALEGRWQFLRSTWMQTLGGTPTFRPVLLLCLYLGLAAAVALPALFL